MEVSKAELCVCIEADGAVYERSSACRESVLDLFYFIVLDVSKIEVPLWYRQKCFDENIFSRKFNATIKTFTYFQNTV